ALRDAEDAVAERRKFCLEPAELVRWVQSLPVDIAHAVLGGRVHEVAIADHVAIWLFQHPVSHLEKQLLIKKRIPDVHVAQHDEIRVFGVLRQFDRQERQTHAARLLGRPSYTTYHRNADRQGTAISLSCVPHALGVLMLQSW